VSVEPWISLPANIEQQGITHLELNIGKVKGSGVTSGAVVNIRFEK
jgi:hypothetical protein